MSTQTPSPVLVTGAAGFIGFHTAHTLLAQGIPVVGVDDLNDYYDVSLKKARLAELTKDANFTFHQADISDRDAMEALFKQHKFRRVIHLAAQAGVRYSLTNPYAYVESNLIGHMVILEQCRHTPDFEHLVYASSSSVYGGNTKLPFSTADRVDTPVSLYAATKRCDELLTQSYSHLYDLPATGLRFFTVYGPWGRPDMSAFIFTSKILAEEPIQVFNHGKMKRDFTYIDDIVSGILAALNHAPSGPAPHAVYNLGNHQSEDLMNFIGVIEEATGKKAQIDFQPLQPGDVVETYADIEATQTNLGFTPTTRITEGIPRFVEWYKKFYNAA